MDIGKAINIKKNINDLPIWDKILRVFLLLSVFLTPVFFLPITNSPIYLNKQVFLIILMLIIFIISLFRFIAKGKMTLPFGLIFFSSFLVLIGLLISSYFSISFLETIRIQAQPLSLILFAVLIFLACFLASEIASGLNLKKVFFFTVFSIFLVSLISLFQIFKVFIFPFDFAKNINFNLAGSHNVFAFLAGAILMAIVAYLTFSSSLKKKEKIILSTIFGILFLYLILVNYQIVWYLLVVFSIILLFINFFVYKRESLFFFRSLFLVILVCVVSIFFLITHDPLKFIRSPLSIEVSPSFSGTLNVLEKSFKEGGALRMALGSGPATFSYVWDLYKQKNVNNTIFWNTKFFGGSSAVLTFIIENGILGTLLLLFFIISFILCGVKLLKGVKNDLISKENSFILSSSFVAGLFLLTSWFFYPPSFMINFLFFVFLGILWGGLALFCKNYKKEIVFPERINLAIIFTLVLIVFIVLGISALYLEGERYVGAIMFYKGQMALNREGNLSKAINYMSKALVLNSYEDSYLRNLSQVLLLEVNQKISQGNIQNAQVLISNAINTAKLATEKNSYEYLNWLNLGDLYGKLIPVIDDAENFAISSYLEAKKRNPNNPDINLVLAQTRIAYLDKVKQTKQKKSKKQIDISKLKKSLLNQALKDIDEAISLKPDYSQSYILKSQIYNKEGKVEKALNVINRAKSSIIWDPVLYFQAGFYNYQLKRYSSAKQEFLSAIDLDPSYSNAHYFLGLILDKEGKKSEAIRQFEIIEKFNPNNNQVKKILSNLRAGKSALDGIATKETEEPLKEK